MTGPQLGDVFQQHVPCGVPVHWTFYNENRKRLLSARRIERGSYNHTEPVSSQLNLTACGLQVCDETATELAVRSAHASSASNDRTATRRHTVAVHSVWRPCSLDFLQRNRKRLLSTRRIERSSYNHTEPVSSQLNSTLRSSSL